MTATFLLPFAMGACDAIGGSHITDALRRSGHGGHDAADHHPDAGTALQYRLKKNGTSGEQTAPADDDIIEL